VWAVERLHTFVYGSAFDLVTDHKVRAYWAVPKPKCRRALNVGVYACRHRFRIIHRPGKDNPADYLSRHTGTTYTDHDRSAKVAEDYINMVNHCAVPKTMSLDEIPDASRTDPTLQQLQRLIHDGR